MYMPHYFIGQAMRHIQMNLHKYSSFFTTLSENSALHAYQYLVKYIDM